MLLELFKQHIYVYIFILTIIEGPITSFVSAGLAAQGLLNIKYIIIIALLGDIIMDIILYTIGRTFDKIKVLKKFKIFNKQKDLLSNSLSKRPFLYLLIIKFTPYLAIPGLIFAGTKKMKFKKYIFYSILISILVKIVYLSIGYTGSFGIKQISSFIQGWKQIALYVIFGIILFILTKKLYEYIGIKIKSKLN